MEISRKYDSHQGPIGWVGGILWSARAPTGAAPLDDLDEVVSRRCLERSGRGTNTVIQLGTATRDAELRHIQTGKQSPASACPGTATARGGLRP